MSLCGLQVLDASNNSLSGALPDAYSAAVQLQHLNLSSNKLNGSTLPAVWSGLYNLQKLDLSYNRLQVRGWG